MKNTHQNAEVLSPSVIAPFRVRQAMAGLEMGDTDEALLNYLDFFSGMIPVEAAYFLHVVPKFDLFRSLFVKDDLKLAEEFRVSELVIKDMAAKINRIIAKERGIEVEYDVRDGDPLEELLIDLDNVQADLAIIGQKSKGKSHGIMAKRLARKVKCNALVIPEKSKPTLNRILVPVDFSSNSVEALQMAIAIKKQCKEPVELICLNVYEMPDFASYNITKTRSQFRKMVEDYRMEAFDAFLHTFAPEDKEHIVKVLLRKEMPWVPHYILEYAENNDIDFMVIGAKGHSNVERLLMGSVTEKLLTINDSIPTLIVK